MNVTVWMPYLIAVNALGFALYTADVLLYACTPPEKPDPLILGISLLGGSPGVLAGMLIFRTSALLSRICTACLAVVQLLILLVVCGQVGDTLILDPLPFLASHRWLLLWLTGINLVTLSVFMVDKWNAIRHLTRVPNGTLILLSWMGGSLGALTAMYLIRHKIRKKAFTRGIPLILATQVLLLLYLINSPV